MATRSKSTTWKLWIISNLQSEYVEQSWSCRRQSKSGSVTRQKWPVHRHQRNMPVNSHGLTDSHSHG